MELSNRQEMTLIACRILVIFVCVSTLTRPIFVGANPTYIMIGVIESIMSLILYGVVRSELLGRSASIVTSLALPAMALPLILITGGVNSPLNILLPIFPFFATLLIGCRFCWISTVCVCLLIVPLVWFSSDIIDIANTSTTPQETYARAYWIIAALILAACISSSFGQIARNLLKTLREEANLDYLTRIANRRGLEQILARETRNAQRYDSWLSVILLDVDDFKEYNDGFGHLRGDECLKKISDIIRRAARSRQDFVGRWGGEEFLIILSDTDPIDTENIAELIRREIECMQDDNCKGVTATLGCCSAVGQSAKSAAMINSADKALYEGKAKGKNQIAQRTLDSAPASMSPA